MVVLYVVINGLSLVLFGFFDAGPFDIIACSLCPAL